MTHKLPPLPYENSALEPHIDTRTMAVHHDKHHQAYVNNLNKALENYPELQDKAPLLLLSDLGSVPEDIRMAVRNHGGGHANHSMFWNAMHSSGGGAPGGKLGEDLDASFGSFEAFKETFSKKAVTLFGVGWTWLCMDGEGKLHIITTQNQDNPVSQGLIPLLGLDVWEHAYYLKYENRRADYIASWWSVVNWAYVSANLSLAKFELGVRDVAGWAEETWSKVASAFSRSDDE